NLRELVEMEDRLRACPGLNEADASLLLTAKQYGFSDQQLAHLWHTTEAEVRRVRKAKGVTAVYKLVDTCAAEFEAFTPYYYSTYESPIEVVELPNATPAAPAVFRTIIEDDTRPPSGKDRIMILGGGPNRIGQGIEFDYCCCQAAFALKEAGFETVMVNSNPE